MATIRAKDLPGSISSFGDSDYIAADEGSSNQTKKVNKASIKSGLGLATARKTVVSTTDPTPDYVGQPGIDANGKTYVAISLTGTMWALLSTKTVVNTTSPTPDYVGQPGLDAYGNKYVAIALTGTMWDYVSPLMVPQMLNKSNIFRDQSLFGEGTFTYGATNAKIEYLAAGAILILIVRNRNPANIYRIAWFKYEVSTDTMTFVIEYSNNMGSSWATCKSITQAMSGSAYYKASTTGAQGELIELSISLKQIKANFPSGTFNYYVVPYPSEGNLILSEEIYPLLRNIRPNPPYSNYFTATGVSFSSASSYEIIKGDSKNFSLKFSANLPKDNTMYIHLYGSGVNYYIIIRKYSGSLIITGYHSVSDNKVKYVESVGEDEYYIRVVDSYTIYLEINGVSLGKFNMTNVYALNNSIFVKTNSTSAFNLNNIVLEGLNALWSGEKIFGDEADLVNVKTDLMLAKAIYSEDVEIILESETDLIKYGGEIISGTFGSGLKKLPKWQMPMKGSIEIDFELNFDVHSSDSLIHTLLDFQKDVMGTGDSDKDLFELSIYQKYPTSDYFNPIPNAYFKCKYGYGNYYSKAILGCQSASLAFKGFNQGFAFSLRYIGSLGSSTHSDLVLNITSAIIEIKHYGGTTEASFTLSSYSTIRDLIGAMEANSFINTNFEIVYYGGIDDNAPSMLSQLYNVYFIQERVVLTDRTNLSPDPPTPPVDPTSYPDWETVFDCFPVYVEYSSIGSNHKIIFTWGDFGINALIDNYLFKPETAKNSFLDYSVGALFFGGNKDAGNIFDGIIKKIRISGKETKPKIFLPFELHSFDISETETAVSYTITSSRLKRLGQYLKQNNYQCLTVADLLKIEQGTMELPARSYLFIIDDYPVTWFTNQTIRNICIQLGIKPSLDIISSEASFVPDKETFRSMINLGWNVHIHAYDHIDNNNLKYSDLVLWLEEATQSFLDNGLASSIMTIPYSVFSKRLYYLSLVKGLNLLFTGGATSFSSKYVMPSLGSATYSRIIPDDTTAWSNVKTAIDNLIV